jgi:hypothetical protein
MANGLAVASIKISCTTISLLYHLPLSASYTTVYMYIEVHMQKNELGGKAVSILLLFPESSYLIG